MSPLSPGGEPWRRVESRAEGDDRAWQALRYFNFYRLVIAGLFIGLSRLDAPLVPHLDSSLTLTVALVYALTSAGLIFLIRSRWPSFWLLRSVQVPLDVLAITLLMHASGGVVGGFGILLVVSTAGACLLAGQRVAVAYASLASLALLSETLYGIIELDYQSASYTQAGLLGAACFSTGLLASWLAEQARGSEALAAARAVELFNLSRLNEYIVQRMGSGIVVMDSQSRILLSNEAALRMTGERRRAAGLTLAEMSPGLHDAWLAWRLRGENRRIPLSLAPKGGEAIVSFAALDSAATTTLVFLEDATETRQRAQQLKLASLGRLTASIAHEIRNPLGALSHAGQLLAESPALPAEDRRLVQIIGEHAVRMNDIVKNVMTISRRDSVHSEDFALVPWLIRFLNDFREQRQLPPAAVRLEAPEDADIIVRMDQSQLHQVLWNLGENALRYSQRDPRLRLVAAELPVSHRPYIDVIDTGPGMTTAVAEQLFEPFFTTRGDGTGLGLYIARELCEANQATLALREHGERGCVFRLSFARPVAGPLVS